MTHIAIYGQTQSGKSTLARRLAESYQKRGLSILVFDPVFDDKWNIRDGQDFKTGNFNEFLRVYWNSEKCMVFIDEASTVCNRFATDAIKTATMGRHKGHLNHYISQRASAIDLTVRDQCSHMFLFNSGYKDCIMHAEEWNCPELKEGTRLETGQYYHVRKMGGFTLNHLFKNEE